MLRRLKDFRRVAIRYDKLARNYFSARCLVAAVVFGVANRVWTKICQSSARDRKNCYRTIHGECHISGNAILR
jgi:hypothetical protein